jgi:hypothetical protein
MTYKNSSLIILLFVIIFAISGSGNIKARVFEDVSGAVLISVQAKNSPLSEVLNDMAQQTGYTFMVDPRWQNLPVTVSLNDVALHEALRIILKDFSVSIIQDNPRQKNIAIIIADMTGSHAGSLDIDNTGDYPNKMVLEKANQTILEKKKAADPLDMEVIPPDQPGGKGVTLRELQAAKSRGKKDLDDNFEVLPPEEPGGKGVTLRELQAAKSRSKENLDNDLEVLPPEKPGEKGISQSEIEQIRSRHKSIEIEHEIPVPMGE